jgi:hypothetical protein
MDRSQLPAHDGFGSKDGSGAGDHDQPYQFGRRPRAAAPWPFTERQYAHLLVLRGRVQDATLVQAEDDLRDAHPIAFLDQDVWVASLGDLLTGEPSPFESEQRAA